MELEYRLLQDSVTESGMLYDHRDRYARLAAASDYQ